MFDAITDTGMIFNSRRRPCWRPFTSSGVLARYTVDGVRDGVTVVVEPGGEGPIIAVPILRKGKMSPDDVVLRLSRAIDAALGLAQRDIDSIKQHMRAGELLLAFENLSTQLYEYEVVLTDTFVTSLTQVGIALGADQHYLSLLDQEDQ